MRAARTTSQVSSGFQPEGARSVQDHLVTSWLGMTGATHAYVLQGILKPTLLKASIL